MESLYRKQGLDSLLEIVYYDTRADEDDETLIDRDGDADVEVPSNQTYRRAMIEQCPGSR